MQQRALDEPSFLQAPFEKAAREHLFSDPLEELLCGEFIEICRDFDITQIQDSWSWRNTHLARELSYFLIDEKGDLNRRGLLRSIRLLDNNFHSLGPNRYHDDSRIAHILKILRFFAEGKEFQYALKRICRPENHPGASQLIRDTLFLSDTQPIMDFHARRAALSALLTTLRQNVGSCFATAPAIMIQQEQPLQFLADIGQLFGTGRLSRVFEGIEYAVPLSINWGVGELFRPILLSSITGDPHKTLALSPGLQAAFEATGLIEKSLDREGRHLETEKILKESRILSGKEDPFSFFTVDELLKQVYLSWLDITWEDVKNFRERTVEGVPGGLLIQAPLSRQDKGRLCERFIKTYEKGQKVFKGFTDNALLKSWEFTLASLSESKADFAKWNLYASLGVQSEEPFGIGQTLHENIQASLDRLNEEIGECQSRYDHLYAQVKYLEGRIRRASTPSELEWLRADYRIRQQELNRVVVEHDEVHDKGRKLANLYPFMIEFYGKKIPEYFQEIYDPQMHDVSTNPYDDSPAGFRLLYKHGRSNPALWTMIYTSSEYIQHLTSFFISTEIELSQFPETEGVGRELSELITAIITTIKQPQFLETSFFRLARTYKESVVEDPMRHLDYVKRKPWAYISGGTMGTLVSCYYGNTAHPKEEKRWVESDNELLAFLIDGLKEQALSTQQIYQKDPNRSLLAFSPTHAFLCKPGWSLFRKAWESDLYTYTWIRDLFVNPQLRFLDENILNVRMIEHLVSEFLHFIPSGYRPLAKKVLSDFAFSMRADEFRESVLKKLSYERWIREGSRHLALIAEELDSILYRSLPLFPEHALRDRLFILFEGIDDVDDALQKKIFSLIEKLEVGRYRILSAQGLRDIAKSLLISALKTTRTQIPFHKKITEVMQANKLAYPQPILFADTNWVKNVFGFIVNPGTSRLELWRFDDQGSEGRPVSIWRKYLNGEEKKEWGLYVAPSEYGQF